MAAILYLMIFLACGVLMVRFLLPTQKKVYRLWLGLSLGLVLMMWLPALMAFLIGYTLWGHMATLLLLLALLMGCYAVRDKRPARPFDTEDAKTLRILLYVALPLTLLGFYLQYTHNLREVNGALHVGQSTYGDLPLHLGIITSLRDAKLPADYSIFPGERLSYPFLTDTLSTSMMLLGTSLRLALIIPGTLMMGLVFSGYVLLTLRMARSKKAAVLASLLLFLNGGLGFLYSFDMLGISLGTSGSNELQSGVWLDRLHTILNGWYQTPVNHAEFSTYNLRWSNIIADMFVPQRTFLGGWMALLPCLYLLYDGLQQKERNTRQFVLLGGLAGCLPLIHTHSYLALVLVSFGWLLWDGWQHRTFKHWLLYVAVAGVLSLPQLVLFTFRQAGGSDNFLRFQFNWVNGVGGMKDGYVWFYLKNIGLPFLLLLLSLFEKNSRHRFMYLGAFVIFLPAELIRFQPNEYDNNKLLYVWYALCCVPIAEYAFDLYDRLKGLRARRAIGILCCMAFFLSGSLSLMREIKSDYMMFSKNDVLAGAFVEQETPKDSLFLSGTQHINPVSALAGRRIVSGPSLWLHFHGFDVSSREEDIRLFYQQPQTHLKTLQKYGVDYILLGPYERRYLADQEGLDALFNRVYQDAEGENIIYSAKGKTP